MPARRPRPTILVKLLFAFVAPAAALFAVFAFVAYETARDNLDAELGSRLAAIAAAAATELRDPSLARLEPGMEDDVRFQQCRARLDAVRRATGVARIYAFTQRHTSVCDTDDGVPIGATYYQLREDAAELARVFAGGGPVASVLFEGRDGRLYKAGYARAAAADAGAALAVGVDAPATYFDRLADLRRTLIGYGAAFAVLGLLVSVVVATRITRPVRRLAAAAERIGRGDLATAIDVPASDEIGLLARTMEDMRRGLRARDERMQMMLSGIAHEVRNPLGGIKLFAGILRDELAGDARLRAHVDRIDTELDHLEAVVGDFLAYARRPAPQPEPVDLAAVGAEVADAVRAEASRAGVEVDVDVDGAMCRADRNQIKRALMNLVRNAVQASSGRAGLRARRRGDAVVVEVWNSAREPIPEDVMARMFEPFFTTKEKGTGLGLAFAREIVEEAGGTIEVRNAADERTVFCLTLPAVDGGTAAPRTA
ncbi:MAG: sensor histidine kinase [Deltaproteobacteria bacterium]|nr:MAG: sensor histidine kinase [Deltaproteobacteria bacterium]